MDGLEFPLSLPSSPLLTRLEAVFRIRYNLGPIAQARICCTVSMIQCDDVRSRDQADGTVNQERTEKIRLHSCRVCPGDRLSLPSCRALHLIPHCCFLLVTSSRCLSDSPTTAMNALRLAVAMTSRSSRILATPAVRQIHDHKITVWNVKPDYPYYHRFVVAPPRNYINKYEKWAWFLFMFFFTFSYPTYIVMHWKEYGQQQPEDDE